MNILDIPDTDIFLLLSQNNIPLGKIKSNEEAYQIAWNLIESENINEAPDSVINWLHAYNNKYNNIEEFNIVDLINANEYDLYNIAHIFGLKEINKGDIIEILYYLNKLYNLDIFNNMSNDDIINLLINMDYKTIRVLCRISIPLNTVCDSEQFNPILRQKYKEFKDKKNS